MTGRPAYLRETVPGTDAAARRKATKVLRRLVADAEREARVSTAAPVSRLLDEWLRVAELEESTRTTYVGYIERVLKPALGTTLSLTPWTGHRRCGVSDLGLGWCGGLRGRSG